MITPNVDQEVEQDIQAELIHKLGKASDGIGVKVRTGLVTLTGHAASYSQKIAAQEAAHRVPGVKDVANDIEVLDFGVNVRSDTEIARAVRGALEWDVLLPEDRIVSTVSGGFVTLEGSVQSFNQRNDAEYAVSRLPGVRGVYNKLAVLPEGVDPRDLQAKIEEALERRAVREAERIQVSVDRGTVTLSGTVQSLDEKHAIIGLASHATGVKSVRDLLTVRSLAMTA